MNNSHHENSDLNSDLNAFLNGQDALSQKLKSLAQPQPSPALDAAILAQIETALSQEAQIKKSVEKNPQAIANTNRPEAIKASGLKSFWSFFNLNRDFNLRQLWSIPIGLIAGVLLTVSLKSYFDQDGSSTGITIQLAQIPSIEPENKKKVELASANTANNSLPPVGTLLEKPPEAARRNMTPPKNRHPQELTGAQREMLASTDLTEEISKTEIVKEKKELKHDTQQDFLLAKKAERIVVAAVEENKKSEAYAPPKQLALSRAASVSQDMAKSTYNKSSTQPEGLEKSQFKPNNPIWAMHSPSASASPASVPSIKLEANNSAFKPNTDILLDSTARAVNNDPTTPVTSFAPEQVPAEQALLQIEEQLDRGQIHAAQLAWKAFLKAHPNYLVNPKLQKKIQGARLQK